MLFLSSRITIVLYLIAGALIIGKIASLTPKESTPPIHATSTTEVSLPTAANVGFFPVAPEVAGPTTTPSTILVQPKQVAPKTPTVAPQPVQPTPIAITKSPDAVQSETRSALVNILCLSQGGGVGSISGSGVMIDSSGVILTNAHVGQFFLLKDYPTPNNITCSIRTGSPAEDRYRGELLYISPRWIAQNAPLIKNLHATSSGAYDFAFIRITGSANQTPLPKQFPSVPMSTDWPKQHDPVLLAGYPASFLGGESIARSLYPTLVFAAIHGLYTFDDANKKGDLVDVQGTSLSQSGSSGGAIVRQQDGAMVALIATATAGATTASRDLWAITLDHIDRAMRAESQNGIAALLTGDVAAKAKAFNTTIAPDLTKKLLDALR